MWFVTNVRATVFRIWFTSHFAKVKLNQAMKKTHSSLNWFRPQQRNETAWAFSVGPRLYINIFFTQFLLLLALVLWAWSKDLGGRCEYFIYHRGKPCRYEWRKKLSVKFKRYPFELLTTSLSSSWISHVHRFECGTRWTGVLMAFCQAKQALQCLSVMDRRH